jgi:GNAT superfamily N-acetyltransferase
VSKAKILPLTANLATGVARLWRRCFPCRELHTHIAWNPAGQAFTRRSIERRILGAPGFDPAGSFVAVSGGRVVGFCLAAMSAGKGPRDGFLSAVCVAPEERRKGLGTGLLARAERYLARRGARRILTTNEGNPLPLLLGVPLETEAFAFLLTGGFRSYDRNFLQVMAQDATKFRYGRRVKAMARRLESVGVRISHAGKTDRKALVRFMARHFPSWHPGIVKNFEKETPDPVLVAVRSGKVLGFAGPFGVGPTGAGHFMAIGVDGAARGLGLGVALFHRMSAELKAGGAWGVHLTTHLHNPAQEIYARAGYRARCVVDLGMRKEPGRSGRGGKR